MHQQSCRVIDNLEDELQQQMAKVFNNHYNEDNVDQVTLRNLSINFKERDQTAKIAITMGNS